MVGAKNITWAYQMTKDWYVNIWYLSSNINQSLFVSLNIVADQVVVNMFSYDKTWDLKKIVPLITPIDQRCLHGKP